jgi:membrane fusion protein (multidrug efflux system)
MVEIGQFVAAASPVGTIYAAGPLRVKVSVPESQSAGVAPGSAVTVLPSALPGKSLPATVKFVSGALREQTRDLVIEVQLEAEDPALRPGMFARVEVDVGEADQVTVPVQAIRTVDGASRVFTVRDGRAYEHVVRLGAERDGRVAVLTDVNDADPVILDPPSSLRDGAKVR